jgi:hypothetical protein
MAALVVMMRAVPPAPTPASCRSFARRAAPLLALLLAACGSRGGMHGVVYECADPASAACAAAREGFQVVRYTSLPPDRLIGAASRALGDLDFEPERDDAGRKVSGRYVASAPVHDKQLDQLFRQTLKAYAPGQDLAALRAEVSAQPLAGGDSGATLRLQLFLPGADGAPRPVDAVGPYQIFFSQLGTELGAPPAPPPEEPGTRHERRPLAPAISGV